MTMNEFLDAHIFNQRASSSSSGSLGYLAQHDLFEQVMRIGMSANYTLRTHPDLVF